MDNAQVTQDDLHDAIYGDRGWRRKEVQAIGAAISTRNWHSLETAYNNLRDKMDARHRLERSEPMGWMGIESAPRDGSVFFAWCPNVGRVIMNIDGVHRNTLVVDRTYRLGCNPTHWMPLPSAPGTTPPEPVAEIERLVEQIVRDVAELPDRSSPIDWPEAMYVTANELAEIVRAALGDASPSSEGV